MVLDIKNALPLFIFYVYLSWCISIFDSMGLLSGNSEMKNNHSL